MESILERFADNLTEVEYITNPAIARDEEIKKLILVLLQENEIKFLVSFFFFIQINYFYGYENHIR